ncbi:MAG: flavin reductase family protein [Oscillospiraceae bacterium]|jgi:flavin reductase (DIM6/NTAB) family NADH-FMN oxidoreductase RutF|nr:flavin reductase family protein [Oscillospiraceae bacterium]
MKKSVGARSLIYPNPVLVVCTYDENGKANAATLAWGGVASSGPSAVSIAVQPIRYTYGALMSRRAFTVNLAPAKYAEEADYFGMVSGRDFDKFAETGLTPVKSELVDAPYIAEFPCSLECVVTHTLDLGVHTLFIGEVKDVKMDESASDTWSEFDLLTFDALTRDYRAPGKSVAKAFEAGRKFIK